jgi:hypothetical protein
MRFKFATYVKSFDLEEFDINATDESRFSDNQKMLNNSQILVMIDSLRRTISNGEKKVGLGISKMFDTTIYLRTSPVALNTLDSGRDTNQWITFKDSSKQDSFKAAFHTDSVTQVPNVLHATAMIDSMNRKRGVLSNFNATIPNGEEAPVVDLKPGLKVEHFYDLLDSARTAHLLVNLKS